MPEMTPPETTMYFILGDASKQDDSLQGNDGRNGAGGKDRTNLNATGARKKKFESKAKARRV
jgi:hypothetical protein